MEQKAAHTPGPWSVRPSSNAKNGAAWRDIVSDGQAFGPSYVGEALERDAYLIAAAPDLFEIARAIVAVCDSGKHADMACMEGSPLVDAARAAIAKAEGGAA